MIQQLQLTNFKSFQQAQLEFGGLTLLVGTNASGKSNLRDALRFLHGVGRGYSLSDIIGERFGEGGERIWSGIRGGPREIAFDGAQTFALSVSIALDDSEKSQFTYYIEVDPGRDGRGPSLISEFLRSDNDTIRGYLFRYDVYRDNAAASRAWIRKWHAIRGWNQALLPEFEAVNQQLLSGDYRGIRDPRLQAYGFDTVSAHQSALVQLVKSLNPVVHHLILSGCRRALARAEE